MVAGCHGPPDQCSPTSPTQPAPRPLGLKSGPLPMEDLYDGDSELTTSLAHVEATTDIPLQERVTHLQTLAASHPSEMPQILNTIKCLKHISSKTKYVMFFDVTPLVHLCAHGAPHSMTDATLRSRLILSLRLYTMARSSDLSNIVPVVWELQSVHCLKPMDKSGKQHLLSIMNRTSALLTEYLLRVHTHPSSYLLCHLE